jgi:DNA-binding HxlR family transcriptional regulator
MGTYTNKKIEEYANEMPLELRRAIEALNDDFRLAIFFVLLKNGDLSFTQMMNELELPRKDSSILSHHLKILEKGALVKNEYAKKEGVDSHSFYDLTEFGEDILNGLMDTLSVPRLVGEPVEPLKKILYQMGANRAEKAFKEVP